MKIVLYTILVVCSALVSTASYASAESEKQAMLQMWPQFCASHARVAEDAMDAYQFGLPLATVVEAFKGYPGDKSIVPKAYETPKYNTKSKQEHAISEFGNEMYMDCAKRRVPQLFVEPETMQLSCAESAEMANLFMNDRQQGKHLAEIVTHMDTIASVSVRNYLVYQLFLAYSEPYFHTTSMKIRKAADFTSEEMTRCMRHQ